MMADNPAMAGVPTAYFDPRTQGGDSVPYPVRQLDLISDISRGLESYGLTPPVYQAREYTGFGGLPEYAAPGAAVDPRMMGASRQAGYVNALKSALGITDPVDTRQQQMAALDAAGSRALTAAGAGSFERGVRGSLASAPGRDVISQMYLPAVAQIEQGYAQQQAQQQARDLGLAQQWGQFGSQFDLSRAGMLNQYDLSRAAQENQFALNRAQMGQQDVQFGSQFGADQAGQQYESEFRGYELPFLMAMYGKK